MVSQGDGSFDLFRGQLACSGALIVAPLGPPSRAARVTADGILVPLTPNSSTFYLPELPPTALSSIVVPPGTPHSSAL
jgi:hypothetical protein